MGVKINYQIADEGIRNNAQINTIFDELECFFYIPILCHLNKKIKDGMMMNDIDVLSGVYFKTRLLDCYF
jgi:hypothetical protein